MSTRSGGPRRLVWSRGQGLADETVVIRLGQEFALSERSQIVQKKRLHVSSPRGSRDVVPQWVPRELRVQVLRSRGGHSVQVSCQEAPAQLGLQDLSTEHEKARELARAELVGAESREGLIVVSGAGAVFTAHQRSGADAPGRRGWVNELTRLVVVHGAFPSGGCLLSRTVLERSTDRLEDSLARRAEDSLKKCLRPRFRRASAPAERQAAQERYARGVRGASCRRGVGGGTSASWGRLRCSARGAHASEAPATRRSGGPITSVQSRRFG